MSDHSDDETGRFTRRTFNRAVGGAAGAALTAAAGEASADRDDDGRRGRGRDERTPALVAHREDDGDEGDRNDDGDDRGHRDDGDG